MKKVLRKRSFVAGVLILVVVCLGIVLAGDVVVREGDLAVDGDLNVTETATIEGLVTINDEVNIIGDAATFGQDAPDVLVATGGTGSVSTGTPAGKGSDIILTAGDGGDVSGMPQAGDGGDILLIPGTKGSGAGSPSDGKVGIWDSTPNYPLEIDADVSGISLYVSANVSATGYNERTSVYDKLLGNALDRIYDSDEVKNPDGSINHLLLDGGRSYEVTDYSRPEIRIIEVEIFDETLGKNQTIEIEQTYYPYQKTVYDMSRSQQINKHEQAIYELKQENQMLKAELAKLKEAVGIE